MIKATTKHGTYYLIDMDHNTAKRVKGSDSDNHMQKDGEWFDFISVKSYDRDKDWKDQGDFEPIQVGKSMYFNLRSYEPYNWRVSTDVISIEEYDE